ncbi:sigma 54-interacting transcriptional regulator [Haliea sp.]|uniref:sigma 54-interacting transcriptional regulator n=1 Tax=Haliea sp. TaxID=1932666 RepID=UPI0035287224
MPEHNRMDATLPSVFAQLTSAPAHRVRVLTIVFHPNVERIGERWVLKGSRRKPLVLGRQQPAFVRAGGDVGRPLDDPHVSRQALHMRFRDAGVTLAPVADACRCRLNGEWVQAARDFTAADLRRGIVLQLAHSVVLLLREVPAFPPGVGEAAAASTAAFSGLLGSSDYMQALRRDIARIARCGLDVLIRGETGSGKELVARAVHGASERAAGPLVPVNMAAIPPGVAAAVLFGSARGAFTGAERNSVGYFQQAEKGSLFLDEVGDTPAEVQPQLLRALQEREIQPVGGTLRTVDVRVISATDAPLEGPDSTFRSALRHRLGSAEICVAPLREHPEDIGELLCHFLQQACAETGSPSLLPTPGSAPLEVAQWADLFTLCHRYDWPGNVRELGNCARQIVLQGEGGLLPAMLSQPVAANVADSPAKAPASAAVELGDDALRALLKQERYEVSAAARRAGMSRQALYRRLPALGLRLAAQVPEAELQEALARADHDVAATATALRVSAIALRSRLAHHRAAPAGSGDA